MDSIIHKRPRGRPRTLSKVNPGSTIRALDRGILLLRALARDGAVTLTDLALSVGMPPSSAHRVLTTLQKHSFVELDEPTQQWTIGIEAFRVGSAYLARNNLIDAARKVMRPLMEETGETANIGIADNGDVVFVSQIETYSPIRAFFRPGTRSHMHASGIGKVLLANMPRKNLETVLQQKGLPEFTPNSLTSPADLFTDLETIRARGWSLDDEEHYTGMRCVAAAIFNAYGEAIAGLSVSGPTVRFSDNTVLEFGPRVMRAANEVTVAIGGRVRHPSP